MGYHILTNFQFDLCHSQNMKGRYTAEGSNRYEGLIITIRQASLDVFWSRKQGTVRGNLTMLRNMIMMSREEIGF